ncbi:hypothetical protein M8494_17160 [Serratia ureilytica]
MSRLLLQQLDGHQVALARQLEALRYRPWLENAELSAARITRCSRWKN